MQSQGDVTAEATQEPEKKEPTTGVAGGEASADDASRAPEEESQSEIPGDPRTLNEEQPPTKEQY